MLLYSVYVVFALVYFMTLHEEVMIDGMNLDYKILTKVIGQRIQVVLPDIIHENQSGFVSGRKIEHSVKLIPTRHHEFH